MNFTVQSDSLLQNAALIGYFGIMMAIINFAIFIFLVVLAWRATKALESAAKAQDYTARLMRDLVVLKTKEEKKS